ncbi:alpha/beta fold hydrolase [Nitriliruptoraceae bacterium ZYF776]|nr:alpha/beta fold hydrolase [Profundirhabdus halotolerans]
MTREVAGRRWLALAVVVALVVACAPQGPTTSDPDEPSAPAGSDDASEEAPGGDGAPIEPAAPGSFPDLDVPAIGSAYVDFGEDGLDRWRDEVPDIEDVTVTSSLDGEDQPSLYLPPSGDGEQPLLVVAHSWSTGYTQHLAIPFARWAQGAGWGFLHPDFRGVNDRPEATGSDLAVQDVVDAIDVAVERGGVDPERVFVLGFSGGGMMSLLLAGRHPDRIAGAVAWVPVEDLEDWYVHNLEDQPDEDYADQIEASCGGDPTSDPAAAEDCAARSPSAHLAAARDAGVPRRRRPRARRRQRAGRPRGAGVRRARGRGRPAGRGRRLGRRRRAAAGRPGRRGDGPDRVRRRRPARPLRPRLGAGHLRRLRRRARPRVPPRPRLALVPGRARLSGDGAGPAGSSTHDPVGPRRGPARRGTLGGSVRVRRGRGTASHPRPSPVLSRSTRGHQDRAAGPRRAPEGRTGGRQLRARGPAGPPRRARRGRARRQGPEAGQAAQDGPVAQRHHQALAGSGHRELRPVRVAVGVRLPEASGRARRLPRAAELRAADHRPGRGRPDPDLPHGPRRPGPVHPPVGPARGGHPHRAAQRHHPPLRRPHLRLVSPQDLRDVALELADLADARTLAAFRGHLEVRTKADGSWVTEVDEGVERELRAAIRARFPDHAILGEEDGRDGPEDAPTWVIDPIDGTTNFVRGNPVFATLVAVQVDGEEVAGVVSAPALGTRFDGVAGGEARQDGRTIHVSEVATLPDAEVAFGGLSYFADAGYGGVVGELAARTGRQRGYGDFWQHCLVAAGSTDLAVEADVKLWDLAAVKVVVEAAGGRFTDLAGRRTAAGGSALSSNGALHDEVLTLFADARAAAV